MTDEIEFTSKKPHSDPPRLALLGLGAMGSRMARRLALGPHELRVWNRSGVPDNASTLAPLAVSSTVEAVEGADVIISMLRDDAASQAVWLKEKNGALKALKSGATLIESSTLTPAWVRKLATKSREQGVHFIDAPVVGSRPQAEAGSLIFLAGGEPDIVERVTPILRRLGSQVKHVGDTPAGSIAKLVVNSLFGLQVAALAELLGFAERSGLELEAVVGLLKDLPVMSPAANAASANMLKGRFEPLFPIELVHKDLLYAQQSAEALGSELPLTEKSRQVFAACEAKGWCNENLTAAIKLYRD